MKHSVGSSSFLLMLLLFFLSLSPTLSNVAYGVTIRGSIIDQEGKPLGFCTISIKGQTKAVVSNEQGKFSIEVQEGDLTLVFQHVGFETLYVDTTASGNTVQVDIVMRPNSLSLKEVIVKPGGEDPAIEIIRSSIRKRKFHKEQVESFRCEAYIKGMIRTNDFPNTFFGQNIDFEDGDTSKRKIIFLSESISDIVFIQPDQQRVTVKSTHVSGQTNGLGLGSPILVSFYDNIVSLPKTFNPRGFISPIADGALHYYNYRYVGMFEDGGVLVNKIMVSPKRKFEPLFSGFIQIIENDWNIHAVSLAVDKEAQLEFAKRILIEQQYTPVQNKIWMVGTQTIYPEINFLGFDAAGYFTTVYRNYLLNIPITTKSLGRTLLKYDSLANKQTADYWNQTRPIALAVEESDDFRKKDSLERKREDPSYMDSLDKIQNKITAMGFLMTGQTLIQRSKRQQFTYDPFFKAFSFNTVEGLALQFSGTYQKNYTGRQQISITPVLRYGTHNRHLTPFIASRYRFGKKFINTASLSFGKKIFQFNNNNPIPQVVNTISTLLDGNNFMKIYEASFFHIGMEKAVGNGLDIQGTVHYQDRLPLNNTLRKSFSPNYPIETGSSAMEAHQSFVATLQLRYRPGARYIELPDRIIGTSNTTPIFIFEYSKGFENMLSSDVNFDKWRASVTGDYNFNIGGQLKYKLEAGGFFQAKRTELPDQFHFIGNLTRVAAPYVESFQAVPYYAFSGQHRLFGAFHAEYRMNGLFTNKIPVIRKYNLRLVTGINMIWYSKLNYEEVFIGVDNIAKLCRVDYVRGFGIGGNANNGIRIGIRGLSSLFTDY